MKEEIGCTDGIAVREGYINLHQAASYLGLSPKTLYVWAEGKKIPAHKVGRLWRFDKLELDHFVRNETAKHSGDPSDVWRKHNSFL